MHTEGVMLHRVLWLRLLLGRMWRMWWRRLGQLCRGLLLLLLEKLEIRQRGEEHLCQLWARPGHLLLHRRLLSGGHL